jgi:hypothetical protein
MNKIFNRLAQIISIGLFILSLTQVAYCTTNLCRSSIDALITGSLGALYGGAALTWFANPFLIISWLSFNRNISLSLVTSLLAVLVSFSFLLFHSVVDNEAGHLNTIISYKAGYWLWTASTVVMGIGNSALYVWRRKVNPRKE